MPFAIVETANVTIGRTFDALLCDPDIARFSFASVLV
jgi:hypothetical protein